MFRETRVLYGGACLDKDIFVQFIAMQEKQVLARVIRIQKTYGEPLIFQR